MAGPVQAHPPDHRLRSRRPEREDLCSALETYPEDLQVPKTYKCAFFYSDFWEAYQKVVPKEQHRATGKGDGQTCHIERFNNTLRQSLARFVRKTLSFSKCEQMQEKCLRLFLHEYNQNCLY